MRQFGLAVERVRRTLPRHLSRFTLCAVVISNTKTPGLYSGVKVTGIERGQIPEGRPASAGAQAPCCGDEWCLGRESGFTNRALKSPRTGNDQLAQVRLKTHSGLRGFTGRASGV